MAATAKIANSFTRSVGGDVAFTGLRQALRSLCPRPLLNWREARFYARYGEVELHLLEFLCRADQDAIDIGANDGSYVHFLRRHALRVFAYEPMPTLARALREKFPRDVVVEAIALSNLPGMAELRMPIVDGVAITGCSNISADASAVYPDHRTIEVAVDRLDDVYRGDAGFIKIDVEGHEQAVLDGAVETIRRCLPRLLVEIDERLSPGGLIRAKAFFGPLGYRGYYVHDGRLERIEDFSIAEMQKLSRLPDLTAPLQERARFGRYIYNFIFLPPGESRETLHNISGRLACLKS
jgi:FkbM family methyltransferase